jgi:hypothetical protein
LLSFAQSSLTFAHLFARLFAHTVWDSISSAGTYQPPAATSAAKKTGVIIGDHEFVTTELNSELRVGRHKTFKLSGQRFASAARNVRAKPEGEDDENAAEGEVHDEAPTVVSTILT